MEIDNTLTEKKIQRILNGFIASPKYSVDGLFVFKWESDKLLWTKAGYIYEFEIKISRPDYKNDFKHKAEKHLLFSSKMVKHSEPIHQELFANLYKHKQKKYPGISMEQIRTMNIYPKDTPMPNYFYYAVPEGLLEPDEVPPYAGLVYITTDKESFENEPDKWLHEFRMVKKAPQLHKTKYTDAELNLGEKFYYNMKKWQRNYLQQITYSLMYRQWLHDELASKHQEKSYKELQDELETAESNVQYWQNDAKKYYGLYRTMVEGADLATIERHLMIAEIKKYNPDFDYQTIINESDRIYEERYPNRK